MVPHFSILPGRIPWTEEPGRLQSRGSQRVRHNWVSEYIAQVASQGTWDPEVKKWLPVLEHCVHFCLLPLEGSPVTRMTR